MGGPGCRLRPQTPARASSHSQKAKQAHFPPGALVRESTLRGIGKTRVLRSSESPGRRLAGRGRRVPGALPHWSSLIKAPDPGAGPPGSSPPCATVASVLIWAAGGVTVPAFGVGSSSVSSMQSSSRGPGARRALEWSLLLASRSKSGSAAPLPWPVCN